MSKDLTEAALIDELHRLKQDLERVPTTKNMKNDGKFVHSTYARRWGSWNAAIRAAGFDSNVQMDIPERELIEELQLLAERLDKSPTVSDMNERGKYSEVPYKDRWDSWSASLEKAGLEPNVRFETTCDELIADI